MSDFWVEPSIGRRVIHDGTGKEGVIIIDVRTSATSVFVLFDGADFAIPVHPDQITFMDQMEFRRSA